MNRLQLYKDKLAKEKGFQNWKAYVSSHCGCEHKKLELMATKLFEKIEKADNGNVIEKL